MMAVVFTATSQVPVPVADQENPILLTGATAHLGDGTVIENAAIGFDKGKLTIVSSNDNVDASGYEVIDVAGKHIYPGFILPGAPVGLQEVGAVRAMNDHNERGQFNPNVRSVISYNTDSEYIPTLRFNGVLLAESTPQGGTIAGTSSLMELEGWNWEDAVHSMDIGIHLNWPGRLKWERDPDTGWEQKPDKDYEKNVTELKGHFKEASAYATLNSGAKNLKLEAMKGLFDGSKRLFIHSNDAKSIIESIRMAQKVGVQKIVLFSGSEALYVAGFLKENGIGVIVENTHRFPDMNHYGVFNPFELPGKLSDQGVKIGLYIGGVMGGRNLPFAAGTAVAHGLDYEKAIQMITINNAELLGVDERVGSLKIGKDATLFVSEGDALDMRTNILSHAFISGKQVTLDNKQQELYKRYSEKYGHTID